MYIFIYICIYIKKHKYFNICKFAGPLAPGVSDPGHHPIN